MAEDLELLDQQHHQLKISEKDQIIPDNHQEEPPATDLVGSPFVEECIKQEIATYKHEHWLGEDGGSEEAARDIRSEIA